MTGNPYGARRIDFSAAVELTRRQHEATERAWQEWEHATFGTADPAPVPAAARLSAQDEAWETWMRATFPTMT